MKKTIPLAMLDLDNNLKITKGKLNDKGEIEYPRFKPTRIFAFNRDATIRIAVRSWFGLGKPQWQTGQFVFEECASPVHFRPSLGNKVSECKSCQKIPYGIVDPHSVHLLKRGEIQWGLVDAANRADNSTSKIEKYWQIMLLIGGAIAAMLVIALFKMGVFDLETWTGAISLPILGLAKKTKQPTKLPESEPNKDEPIKDEFTQAENIDDGFGQITSALNDAPVDLQQFNVVEEMFNDTNLDQKTRLSPLLAVRLEVAEMIGVQEDLPELLFFCDGLKRKRISIDGESRREAVQLNQANTQIGLNLDTLRRTSG